MIGPFRPLSPWYTWARAVVLLSVLPVAVAEPQAVDPSSTIHFPYNASMDGAGSYEAAGQRTQFLTLRVPVSLKGLTEQSWGLRLRLTAMLGAHRFDVTDLDSLRITSLGLIPGLEALVPVGRGRTLRPYVDLGPASSLDTLETTLVWAVGIRGEFVFPWKRFLFGVGPGLAITGAGKDRLPADSAGDDYIDAALKLEARHPLWFAIRGRQPDLGISLKYGYYIDALQFTSVGGQVSDFTQHWEVGVSFGFHGPRPKILMFRVPRIGLGYRFGGGLTGLRITIGGDWISKGIPWR